MNAAGRAALIEAVKAEALACFGDARGSHDWDHTERVLRLCLRIGRREKADLFVLRLAALLHDIGRAFLFAGEVGARLHDRDIDVEKTKPYTKDDTAYREFLVKLRHIKDRMTTAEGRRIARERHTYMVDFFARLNRETAGVL